ncbi:hypothetical protein M8818_000224 [Zalaria obscura]|uniref:Uncharacterized protein n=1 Tax=Zalaria obscura TaxID=2024903 RepID=A0ACC3SP15_9PEZI
MSSSPTPGAREERSAYGGAEGREYTTTKSGAGHEEQENMDPEDLSEVFAKKMSIRSDPTDTSEAELELPPLPSDHDTLQSALIEFSSSGMDEAQLHSDGAKSLDEREMRRHLMDVESSFLPEPMPPSEPQQRVGADDTFVNIGSPGHTPPLSSFLARPNSLAGKVESAPLDEESSPPTPADAYKTPAPERWEDDGADEEEDEGELPEVAEGSLADSDPSSPAAEAARRGHNRSVSTASSTKITPVRANSISVKSHKSNRSTSSRPQTPPSASNSRPSTARAVSSQPQEGDAAGADPGSLLSLNGIHSLSPNRLGRRPSYPISRHSSQRSSTSSQNFGSELSSSDITINADYALQTGGAIPGNASFGSRASLSRLPSLGSVASAMSRDENDGAMPPFSRGVSGASILGSIRGERPLDKLDEERHRSMSPPETPRASTGFSHAPTDTVLARHVQDIQVPETIAREYRQMHGGPSPDKRPASSQASTYTGRAPRNNLTLKEQNSKIDKLTKENFDLKLKIHFLDEALQRHSDEGVMEMINRNVQLQTDLANERKESQSLRRKIREMEKKMKEQEDNLAEARRRNTEAQKQSLSVSELEQLQEEITYLSEELDRRQVQITKLSAENLAKEVEKRKMADYVNAMSERKGNEQSVAEEETEMWKDLLQSETARREQAEDDARKLREELLQLRSERIFEANTTTSNKYSFIGNKRKHMQTQSISGDSNATNDRNGAATASSVTLVDKLTHENAELRRDLGAQTSMLTSRNKERERLQQEIEDLKLLQRKSDGTRSLAGDSIFERSISRAHQRPASRASAQTGMSQISEAEREEWEKREGRLRDQNAALRLDYQELEREAQARGDYIAQLEEECQRLDEEIKSAVEDLKSLQKERDDALQALDHRDAEFERQKDETERLRDEAIQTIEGLENDLEQSENGRNQLAEDLQNRNDDFRALQNELKLLNNSLIQLEDDRNASLKRIEQLEQEVEETTQELDSLDKKLREANQKCQRLEVQSESLHGEISFLREEQEGDKIRIGDLENELAAAQQNLQDEKERMQELEESLIEERRQREIVDDQSKQEVQKVLNELNAENSKTKDEVRRLRRSLSAKENEATTWKTRLEDLESNLRRALGDLNGTRVSLLQDIEKLQTDLENTSVALEHARADLADKDRLLRNRDMLLESSGLESRRLSELLDKERAARKHELQAFEAKNKGASTHLRTIAQHETRVMELETARSQDKRRMVTLETQYREQLTERNNLLLALWNRLSTLNGQEWAQRHRLVNGEVPSLDVIARSLPAFSSNLVEAVKCLEGLVGSFKARVRQAEKSLGKDYQTLSQNLDARVKRMDFLERAVKDAQAAIEERAQLEREQGMLRPSMSNRSTSTKSVLTKSQDETARLKQEIKILKAELKLAGSNPNSNSGSGSGDRRQSTTASSLSPRNIAHSLLRHHSSSAVETLATPQKQAPIVIATPPIQPTEQRWIHRLKELERRLKAEREARLLDRRGARQRLEEKTAESEELRLMLEREKERRGSWVGSAGDEGEGGEGVVGATARRGREGSVD